MHQELAEQWGTLSAKLRGHYQYYGLRGNFKMLEVAYEHTELMWKKGLRRRNSKDRMSWEKFRKRVAEVFPLPPPRIVHAY
jgi:hypothetical protein